MSSSGEMASKTTETVVPSTEKSAETTPMESEVGGPPEEVKTEKPAEKSEVKEEKTKSEDGKPPLAQHDSSVLDLAFAMDCTGSMGSYIKQAQSSIRHIVEQIVSTEKSDIHLALVEYRDHPPQDQSFVTRVLDFTPSVSKMKKQLDKCSASGGGDCPEAVADALHQVSKLSWRAEATKICVFIADAPPHGLGVSSDGFPNGCPDNLDPMEISGVIAQKGITMYMVGCEPAILRYRDFFMTIAHMTGGQYVPLANAQLLAQVIIGGAQEEITLDRLIRSAQEEVEADVMAMGGWDRLEEHEDEITTRVMSKVNARGGFKSKQLQMGGASLPEASKKAKKWSNLKNMADVRKEYVEDSAERGGSEDLLMCAAPLEMGAGGGARKNYGARFSLFKGKSSKAKARKHAPKAATAMERCASPLEDDDSSPPPAAAEYNVAEKDEIDVVQTKRMLQKMRNAKKM